MKNNLIDGAIGGIGIVATEVAQNVQSISPDEIGTIGNLLIQIAIAVATIFGIFKRKKN